VIQLGKQQAGRGIGGAMRAGAGGARGQIVRLVDHEERLTRVESGLIVEKPLVIGREDVIEVADPHVLKRKGSTRDLVRANQGLAAGSAKRVQVVRLFVVQVEFREPAARPALGAILQIGTVVAHAVEGVVHAVLGLVADLPVGQSARRRHVIH
jgi:hypothetical protein